MKIVYFLLRTTLRENSFEFSQAKLLEPSTGNNNMVEIY